MVLINNPLISPLKCPNMALSTVFSTVILG